MSRRPLYYFDRHLVAWRDDAGELHVQDAFCPHLGAHLGHGGTVEGCELVCPFHGWKFDAEGTNTDIPYSRAHEPQGHAAHVPGGRAQRRRRWSGTTPTRPSSRMWEIPELPEFNGDPEWSTVIRTEHTVDAAWQEMAENGVDSAHFRYVHNTAEVPEIESYETGVPGLADALVPEVPHPARGDGGSHRLASRSAPACRSCAFSGIVDTMTLAVTTPDHGRTSASPGSTSASRRWATRTPPATWARPSSSEVDKQFLEDMPIWEHKAHLVRPALADNDGPFMKFRKWAAQFYAEAISDERTVFPPPWWPDRADEAPAKATASAKHRSA